MTEKSLYRVAVDCVDCTVGPHKLYVLVVARDAHEALDCATKHSNANRLWDEMKQRRQAELNSQREDHLIKEVEFVGEI